MLPLTRPRSAERMAIEADRWPGCCFRSADRAPSRSAESLESISTIRRGGGCGAGEQVRLARAAGRSTRPGTRSVLADARCEPGAAPGHLPAARGRPRRGERHTGALSAQFARSCSSRSAMPGVFLGELDGNAVDHLTVRRRMYMQSSPVSIFALPGLRGRCACVPAASARLNTVVEVLLVHGRHGDEGAS